MKKIFIVGCIRSGTTMFQQALNRHSQIVITGESEFFSMALGYLRHSGWAQRQHLMHLNRDFEIEMPLPPRRIRRPEEARAVYEEMGRRCVARLGREPVYFGDKTPQHLPHLGRIMAVYPDAKVILVYRDGRDVALSVSRVPWGPADVYAGFALWLKAYRWHEWALRQQALDLLCVRYEDLASSPGKELRRVTEFLGLEYEPWMAEGEGNREGVLRRSYGYKGRALEKISAVRIGQWRQQLSPRQIHAMERWGGRALRSLGYELTTDGEGGCPPSVFVRASWKTFTWRTWQAWRLAQRLVRGGVPWP
jgi:hypothetical protein